MVKGTGIRAGRIGLGLGAVLVLLLMFFPLLFGSGVPDSPIRVEGDLDGDGNTEEYFLQEGSLTVTEGEEELWASPPDWHVDSFVLADADNDGRVELVMSLWKEGSFGEIHPFWHTDEDISYKNHLFVYMLERNTMKPVWCSSELHRPILSFSIYDADGDRLNELVVEEGQYRKTAQNRYAADRSKPAQTTVWRWEEWGFRLQSD